MRYYPIGPDIMDDDLADWYPAASAARLRAHEPTEDDCAKCNEEFSANQLEVKP